MSLREYLVTFRQALERIDTYGFSESIVFHEELRAGKQAIIKAEIVLVGNHLGCCQILGISNIL